MKINREKAAEFIANQQHQAEQNSASIPATPVAAKPDTSSAPSVPETPASESPIQQPGEEAPFTNGRLFHYLLNRADHPDTPLTVDFLKIRWGITDDQVRKLLADLRTARILEEDNTIKNRAKIIELLTNMSEKELQKNYTFVADDHPSLAQQSATSTQPAAPSASPSPAAAPADPAAAPENTTYEPDPTRAGNVAKTLFEKILAGANNNKAAIAVGAFASALLVAGALQTRPPKTTSGKPATSQTVPKAKEGQPDAAAKKVREFSQGTPSSTGNLEVPPGYRTTPWFIQLSTARKEAVAHILDTQDAQEYITFFFKELPEAHGTKRTKLTLEQQRNLYKYLNNGGGVLLSIARSADPVPAWVLDSPGGAQQTEGSYNMQTNVQEMLTNFANALPPPTKLPLEKTFAEIYNQVRNTLIEEIRSTQAK